jgi:hypothetical protein
MRIKLMIEEDLFYCQRDLHTYRDLEEELKSLGITDEQLKRLII